MGRGDRTSDGRQMKRREANVKCVREKGRQTGEKERRRAGKTEEWRVAAQ